MEQRISLVTLGVKDLARARAFSEAMGWAGAQQPDDEVAFFQAGGDGYVWEVAHNRPIPPSGTRGPRELKASPLSSWG